MPEVVINHEEAHQFAEMKKNESNLARAYLEYCVILHNLRKILEEVKE